MKVLVIGLGSIGRRHARNLRELGQTVLTCDLVQPADLTTPTWNVDAVVIATPPATHLALAQEAAAHQLPMLIEKPLGLPDDVSEWERLAGATILVGYQWRYAPELQRVCARSWQSWGIADYHGSLGVRDPAWLNNPAQGGGVLLEYSHAIDYALWACHQDPLEVLALGDEKRAILALNGGFPQVHLSFEGEIPAGRLRVYQHEWNRRDSNLDHCYVEEMRHFLAVIAGHEAPLVTLKQSLDVLHVVEAARRSFRSHRWERTVYGERRLSRASA